MRMTESTEDFPNKEHLKSTLLPGKDEIWEAHDTSPQNHLWTEETSTDGLLFYVTPNARTKGHQMNLIGTRCKTDKRGCSSHSRKQICGSPCQGHCTIGTDSQGDWAKYLVQRQTGGYHTNYMFKSETKIAAV